MTSYSDRSRWATFRLVLAAAVVGVCALAAQTVQASPTPAQLNAAYKLAVWRAQHINASDFDDHLTPITHQNPNLQWKQINGEDYVLGVTWNAGKFNGLEGKPDTLQPWQWVWITAVPYMADWCHAYHPTDLPLSVRLAQLLGMPPDAGDTVFTTIWVRPKDLRRPAPDPRITTTTMTALDFPPNFPDNTYQQWFYQQAAVSYVMPDDEPYPWTRLGYTYDWGNPVKPHIGLSEYVIEGGSTIYIDANYPTADYCKTAGASASVPTGNSAVASANATSH
jgi:hypothetical protein